MHFKPYLLMALVLILAMGMGCGGSGNTLTGGGDPNSAFVGTWTLVSSSGGAFPQTIVMNGNGTGSYSGNNFNSNITWSVSGNQATISTGAAQSAIATLGSTNNTFTLNSLSATGIYNRA